MKTLFWITTYSILATITVVALGLAIFLQRGYLNVYQTLQECQASEVGYMQALNSCQNP